jgi:S-DNA-T family DNA segregation ATPase FtsK/SpoIIIE
MIDPKRVEYAQYCGLPHLLHPVIDEIPWAVRMLEGLCIEMDKRYTFLANHKIQSVEHWNAIHCPTLNNATIPQLKNRIYPIIVFIDEYADLVLQDKRAAKFVTRLAQKARAAGIHLVLCTQHPKADIINTTITSNFPTQIAFQVRTRSASGVILDRGGAENLLRKGDMIFQNAEETYRAQGPFVSQNLTNNLVQHWSM